MSRQKIISHRDHRGHRDRPVHSLCSLCPVWREFVLMMNRSILIMTGGIGGHIFGCDITRAARALVFAENVANMEVLHV